MGLYSPTPMEVQSHGQPQRLFDPSRARYAGGLTGAFAEEVSDDTGYRAYEEGGIVIPELQTATGMPVDMLAQDEADMRKNEMEEMSDEEMPDMEVESEDILDDMEVNVDTSMLTAKDEEVLEDAIESFPELMEIIPKVATGSVKEFTEGEVEG